MSDTLPPPFYDMGAYKFQEFSAELLGKEERFEDSQVYGRNGQSQRGIDVIAPLKGQQGVEVGQCKCWTAATAPEISKATDEFIQHLADWKMAGVRRFILFVACATNDTKVQDQILLEKTRFLQANIQYEVWDARKLRTKLRPHPDVVLAYCGEHWVQTICGPQRARSGFASSDAGLTTGTETVVRQWGIAIADLAASRGRELDEARELVTEGQSEAALNAVEALCANASWPQMPPEVQGKSLRLRASLLLGLRDDIQAARALLCEAKRIDPQGSIIVLETLLTYREQGAQAAADFLNAPRTIDEWNLKQRLLLELGRPAEVLKNFSAPVTGLQFNAESSWAKGMALLLTRQLGDARAEIARALSLKPRHFDLRFARAIVRYMSSMSPVFKGWGHLTWPVPPSWNLVRRDTATRQELREAVREFRDLASLVQDKHLREFRIWELACLGNDPERQEEAERMVNNLLRQWPDCVPVVVWAKERGYEFDSTPVLAALEKRLAETNAEIDEILACFSIVADRGDLKAAESILDNKRSAFSSHHADYLWTLHKVQVLAANGKSDEALKLAEAETDPARRLAIQSAALRAASQVSKSVTELAQYLEVNYDKTHDPNLLLDCCLAKRHSSEWKFIADHAMELIQAIQTEAVLRLGAQGAFNANNPELCLDLLENNKHLCLDSRLPIDLRHLAAECHRRSGHLPQAIHEAERLVQEGAGIAALAQLFRLQREKGDLRAAALTARKFLEVPSVPPQLLMEAIPATKHQDPELAQELWRHVRICAACAPPQKYGQCDKPPLHQVVGPIVHRVPATRDDSWG